MLDISYQEAYERGYTLNRGTREALSGIALHANNGEARKAIDALDL